MSIEMLVAERRTGKTTQAMAWVSHGRKVAAYPGWSRVLVVPTHNVKAFLRYEWWSRLQDFDHRVYALGEWKGAHNVSNDVEVCIDELEMALQYGVNLQLLPGRLAAVTVTGTPWKHLEFQPRT